MARRGRGRRTRRPRRRNAAAPSRFLQQRFNSIIKGSIAYGKIVELSLSDFTDLPTGWICAPWTVKISICAMNAPTYCNISQWDGGQPNAYWREDNMLIGKSKTHSRTYRWPNEITLMAPVNATQIMMRIVHSPGGDVYGSTDKPLIFYMAELSVRAAKDALEETVDPPHQNIKH